MSGLPLEDIQVLDLTHDVSGPFCTMLLGDLGADVIKVEKPEGGDESRSFEFLGPSEFLALNRNKKSITLNLKTSVGSETLSRLISKSDVLVENFRPGTMQRLGFDYQQSRAINRRLIYCSITGFGQDGPDKDRGAWDPVIQALIGIQATTGEEGQPPVRIGASVFDAIAGLYAALGIMAALRRRKKSGCGQFIDISMLDCGFSMMTYWIPYYSITGKLPPKMGTGWPGGAPYEIFKAKDKSVFLAASNERFWQHLCKALGTEKLLEDARFTTNELRVKNRDVLHEILNAVLANLNSDEVIGRLAPFGMPCAPICNVEDAVANTQLNHRKMIQEIEYSGLKRVKVAGSPLKFSETEVDLRLFPPLLGQHNEEILNSIRKASTGQPDKTP